MRKWFNQVLFASVQIYLYKNSKIVTKFAKLCKLEPIPVNSAYQLKLIATPIMSVPMYCYPQRVVILENKSRQYAYLVQ